MTELERAINRLTQPPKGASNSSVLPPPSPASPIARSANRSRNAGPSPTTKAPAAFATMATVIETAAKRSEDALHTLTNLLTPGAPLLPFPQPPIHKVSSYAILTFGGGGTTIVAELDPHQVPFQGQGRQGE